MINGDELERLLGSEVLIRLRPGLDERHFGTGWRIGWVTGIAMDLFYQEAVISLNDGAPGIYTGHIDFLDQLTPAAARR